MWRLIHYYPGEFTKDNFGNTPLGIIEDALLHMDKHQTEQAAMQAKPISSVGIALCLLKGVKAPNSHWFNPYEQRLYQRKAGETIPPAAARVFLDLAANHKLPSWIGAYIDIDLIKAAAFE